MRDLRTFLRTGALVVLAAVLSACGGGGGGGDSAAGSAAVSDTSPPTVIATTPVNGASGVALNATLSATASKAMAPATLNSTTFTLVAVGGAGVAGTITLAGNTATYTPVVSLAPGTQYIATISVGATDTAGIPLAAPFTWTFTTVTVPGAPIIGTATSGNTQASVTFAPPASNGGATITSYTATSNPGAITASGAGSPIVVPGLINGTPYTFTVTATNTIGTGAPSAPSNSATPALGAAVPGAPTVVTAVAGNAQTTVNFTAPGSSGSSAIISYTVTSSPGGITASGGSTSIVVPGLTNGTVYTFTVVAFNSVGPGPASGPSNAVTPAGLPGAPTGAAATAGNGQVSVAFAAPASNGGSAKSTPGWC